MTEEYQFRSVFREKLENTGRNNRENEILKFMSIQYPKTGIGYTFFSLFIYGYYLSTYKTGLLNILLNGLTNLSTVCQIWGKVSWDKSTVPERYTKHRVTGRHHCRGINCAVKFHCWHIMSDLKPCTYDRLNYIKNINYNSNNKKWHLNTGTLPFRMSI